FVFFAAKKTRWNGQDAHSTADATKRVPPGRHSDATKRVPPGRHSDATKRVPPARQADTTGGVSVFD
ncbi:MAG: hypothetical protein J5985_02495, partial [Kiritimatiellae bacterium]|nr:hypothetical protein [Kiritimatiellia bacterium]